MKTKTILVTGLVVVVGAAVASVLIVCRELAQPAAPPTVEAKADSAGNPARPVAPRVVETTAPETPAPEPASPPPTPRGKSVLPPQASTPQTPPARDPRFNDPVVKEQLGRYALNFVGANPDADAAWALLIYDTSLSETVRGDLMEDLNENGFSGGDGSIPTVDDLPLIESRLALLEEHMVGADEFTLEHLAEAYKDLMNMWVRLGGQ